MGVVTYVIEYTPKTIKAQLSPPSTFQGGLEEFEVGEGGKRVGGQRKDIFLSQ